MREDVKNYYGDVLSSSDDLKTDACCTVTVVPEPVSAAISRIHPDVQSRYYGCGLIAPDCLEGLSVLDLGSGSGRDAYVLSQLVGEAGQVTGVDMTEDQLDVASRWLDYHREVFGYSQSNVEFIRGDLDYLGDLGLPESHYDVIVSNCVINLLDNKADVLATACRLLKPGGEFFFSDVYASRRIAADLREDPVLRGECLSGALYLNDFERMAQAAGFTDPRIVEHRPLLISDPAIEQKLAGTRFASVTYRLVRAESLEPSQEDYGHRVCYQGTIETKPERFELDAENSFTTGESVAVCGNTHEMIRQSRFAAHCELSGSFKHHLGEFTRQPIHVFEEQSDDSGQTVPSNQAVSGCCG